jgi:hypothetical protein
LLITTNAAAPSEICDAEPAVTVPFLSKEGRSLPSDSTVVSARTPSSVTNITGSPLRCGAATGSNVNVDDRRAGVDTVPDKNYFNGSATVLV